MGPISSNPPSSSHIVPKTVVSNSKTLMKYIKNSPMAQMTQIMSFGPVYVDSAFQKPSSSYIVPKTVVSNCKTRMKY